MYNIPTGILDLYLLYISLCLWKGEKATNLAGLIADSNLDWFLAVGSVEPRSWKKSSAHEGTMMISARRRRSTSSKLIGMMESKLPIPQSVSQKFDDGSQLDGVIDVVQDIYQSITSRICKVSSRDFRHFSSTISPFLQQSFFKHFSPVHSKLQQKYMTILVMFMPSCLTINQTVRKGDQTESFLTLKINNTLFYSFLCTVSSVHS